MATIDLSPIPIPAPVRLDQIRTSRLFQFGPVQSGIDKKLRTGPLYVSKLGLPGDEHDLTFHGGVDKAIHQYCSDHYPFWQSLFQDDESAKARFIPGGFGENLVASGFNETNICVGDIISISYSHSVSDSNGHPSDKSDQDISNGCLLEVSLPRQPCFKLNQRFGIKNFAPRTHQQNKTGWYYRVKKQGHIEAGMEIKVVKRVNPRWSIARLHHYVHRERTDLQIAGELKSIDALGKECKDVFDKRLTQHEAKSKAKTEKWLPYRLASKSMETPRIVRLGLTAVDQDDEDKSIPFGSYAVIRLPNGLKRPYSIVEGTTKRFVLGVALEDKSRGGSTYIHDTLQAGDNIDVGSITRTMEPNGMASHYIFIVGGIGITAFLMMMKRLHSINQTFELHYAVRKTGDVAFKNQLADYGISIHIYDKSKGERMDIENIVQQRLWNSHVYTCGPDRMTEAVKKATKAAEMTDDEVHYETFSADTTGDPFTVDVLSNGCKKTTLNVNADESLLQALRRAGFEVSSSCETGQCSTCKLPLKGGRVEHRGTGLSEEEQEKELLSCVSRGIGHISIQLEQ